jgi:ligand-binding SRPBCC domain-containing protein
LTEFKNPFYFKLLIAKITNANGDLQLLKRVNFEKKGAKYVAKYITQMKTYRIKRTQTLHTTLDKAWTFFSCPDNLCLITPAYMKFNIIYKSGEDLLHKGQIIHYTISILPGLPVHWVTEITDVNEPNYFVDVQRKGPYRLWHHQHFLREVDDGVEMTDEVNYSIPFGLIGRLANAVFVEKRLNAIFEYRFKALAELFKDDKTKIGISA